MQARSMVVGIPALLGTGGVVEGLFMLADPANWYFAVPGVTGTGRSTCTSSATSD